MSVRHLRRLSALCLAPLFGCVAPRAQDPDQLLRSLTLEQKAGQLFVSWSLSRPSGDNHAQLLRWVEEVGLGGVILSLGEVGDAAALIPELQAKAEVPLLLASDFEGGVWFRLQGATELGNQMLVGATGDARLAEGMGRVTGEEAKALGFHWVFAPVLDVNSNPDNPIINVRSLGEEPDVPATLSRRILHDVLREELGFEGLVVTDALDMGGVKNKLSPGEVAVRALLAGADVLLMPPDPLAARQAVVDAVESGRVSMARLDDAVGRILAMKARVGLLSGGGRVAEDWQGALKRPESVALAEEIAARGPVLVRDRDGAVQSALQSGDEQALLVTLVDKQEGQGDAFARALDGPVAVGRGASVQLSNASSEEEVEQAVAKIATAQNVVVAVYVKVREFTGGLSVPANLQPVLDALRDEQDVVLVSFGNPYLVRAVPRADAYVAAFTRTAHVQRAVARALRGEGALLGRLPVGIPEVAEAGSGRSLRPAVRGDALDVELEARLQVALDAAVSARAFPGAVCVVTRHGEVTARVAAGRVSYDADAAPVDARTRYDLASLTKVCATTPAVLALVADGVVSLDDPVQKWVPGFVGAGKDAVTVRHLMAHQGGLPSYVRFFRSLEVRDQILQAAAAEGLMLEPGTSVRYSDLGFMLLMAVVEAASGQRFEDFVAARVTGPFGMDAGFAPTAQAPIAAAPTEQDAWRGRVVQGHVHDENAFAMGGVSGHAGLFATADGVSRYASALLAGGGDVLPRALVEAAARPAGVSDDVTRGLGFQLLRSGTWAGTEVPAGTFGHTGFTGTSLWCSPRHDVSVVLLTNRVHPTRVNNQITAARRAVHDAVMEWLR